MLASGDADESRLLDPVFLCPAALRPGGRRMPGDAGRLPGSRSTRPFRVIEGLEQSAQSGFCITTFAIIPEGNEFIGSGQLDGNGIPPNFFFNDPLVRKAFAYCFNYETFLNDVYLGDATRSKHVMLPGMLGYNADAPSYSYDPVQRARSCCSSPGGPPTQTTVGRLTLTVRSLYGRLVFAFLFHIALAHCCFTVLYQIFSGPSLGQSTTSFVV